MRAFYNEIDTYCCDWLSNLMDAGHITSGVICDKSIEDVFPDELRGFDRCHFFAGIGVWDYALNLAGWRERPVWTGSAPCQPFSAAGKGLGFADERHLWPYWFHLIGECRPTVILGEQVASSAVDEWIDLVQVDVETLDYAYGCEPFPAAGVGAPGVRDRAYWLAHATPKRYAQRNKRQGIESRWTRSRPAALRRGNAGRLADADGDRCSAQAGRELHYEEHHAESRSGAFEEQPPGGPTNGFWRAADWLCCRDGKWRPVEPGTFPLADGATSRVGRLRAYGNAINAQAAAEFIRASREAIE